MKDVKDILDRKGYDLYTVQPDITVYEAVRVMGEKEIGSLLVMEKGEMVGIITERDYARKVVLKGRQSPTTMVREIMTPHPGLIVVTPDITVERCMELMTGHNIRHLPVLVEGRVTGLISISDVVNAVITQQKEIIEGMTDYLYNRQ